MLAALLSTAVGALLDVTKFQPPAPCNTATAATLKRAINAVLWDEAAGAFRDNPNPGTTVHPQDGNSLACWFNVTTPARCSSALAVQRKNWNAFGSKSPEWHGDIGCVTKSESTVSLTGGSADPTAPAPARV